MQRRSFLKALGLGAAAGVASVVAKETPSKVPVDTSSVQTAKPMSH